MVETRQLRTGPETFLSYYPDEKRSSNIKEAGDSPVLLQTLTHVSLSELGALRHRSRRSNSDCAVSFHPQWQ